jgi:hypothetical protein
VFVQKILQIQQFVAQVMVVLEHIQNATQKVADARQARYATQ